MAADERLPESIRNALLRRVDWRFLLRRTGVPRALNLASGRTSRAVRLVTEEATSEPGGTDLAVLGRPTRRALAAARETVSPGGEVACLVRVPAPGGTARLRRRLRRAGFTDVRIYWPGPLPHRPQFWLPVHSPAAVARFLALRPARSRSQAALRPLWRSVARAGMLTPIWALARVPEGPGDATDAEDELEDLLGRSQPQVLLTGGKRSINKVVVLPFAEGRSEPSLAIKVARVSEAEADLRREGEVLGLLEAERPGVRGIPRKRAEGRRAGRLALAENAIGGRPLLDRLSPENFADMAKLVTRWLIGLAEGASPQPVTAWWPRLVDAPLEDLALSFEGALAPGTPERARGVLEGLGDLPQVPEHRDCSPWNIVLTPTGEPALLDWESAEPRGLPALDLVYFLANAAFVLDRALESGRTRDTYARLLDPATAHGRVASECLHEYSDRVGLDDDTLGRLRLLCWIVHCRSEFRHAEMDAAAAPDPRRLRSAAFLGLVEEELERTGGRR